MPQGEALLRELHLWPGMDGNAAPSVAELGNKYSKSYAIMPYAEYGANEDIEADRSSITKRVNKALDEVLGEGSQKTFRALQHHNICWPRLNGKKRLDGPRAIFLIRNYGPTVALEVGKIMTIACITDAEKRNTKVERVITGAGGETTTNVLTVKSILDAMESNAAVGEAEREVERDSMPFSIFDYENAESWAYEGEEMPEEAGKLLDGSRMIYSW